MNIGPEKEAEIRLFRRRRSERIQADPESEKRWYLECDEYAPVRALRAKRDQVEREQKNYFDELNERRRKLFEKPGCGGDIYPDTRRISAYLNDLHALTEQLRDFECLCEAKAEVIRAHREAADPATSDPAAAKRWLGLCERYRSIVAQCWYAECERREREVFERECSARVAASLAGSTN
ncbi:hypothetical protein AC244_30590 [Ensifer adhaerens]|uniref:Uncharacterized protein n=2 Tax=Ensifer adhaerens TaxID=106592 RepID=A0A0L8BG86_ENSAD|nr:hypothetical protein AC244_30590 [Ensifer adhaerens]